MARIARVVLLLACGIAGNAAAQQVYKCVDAQGAVSYQSQECGAARTERAWEHGRYAPPASEDMARVRALEQQAQARAQRARQVSTTRQVRESRGTPASSIGACEAAKQRRDQAVYRLGPRRSIESLRALDQDVFRACR